MGGGGGGAEPMVMAMVAVNDAGALSGDGTNVEVDQLISRFSPGATVEGRGTVITRPVSSTVGTTVGSVDVTEKVVPAGKAAPAGSMVPVNTRVFPGSAGSMGFS